MISPIVYKAAARVLAVATLLGVLGCSLRQAEPIHVAAEAKAAIVKAKPKPIVIKGPVSDCRASAGDPAKGANWQADNLVLVNLPWKAHAAWDPRLVMTALQVHRSAAPSLVRALNTIWLQAGHNQAEIDRLGLSAIGGGYNYRPVRHGVQLSAHAYGCAVDFDPDRNAMGDNAPNFSLAENHYVIDAFRDEGWTWGGLWHRPDGMHFEAKRVAA